MPTGDERNGNPREFHPYSRQTRSKRDRRDALRSHGPSRLSASVDVGTEHISLAPNTHTDTHAHTQTHTARRRERSPPDIIDIDSHSDTDDPPPRTQSIQTQSTQAAQSTQATQSIQSTQPAPPTEENTDSRLSHMKCVICLDRPTDLTATRCGHLFCHECIVSALTASANGANGGGGSGSGMGTCPVCRRKQSIRTLVVLELMKAPILV